jgi:hypothetical protein
MGCAALTALTPVTSHAQNVASDSAQNYTSGNWPSPAPNNGFGFGSWSFNNTTPNGGFSGQFLGSSGGIDSANGNSFGMYANSAASAQSTALRPFLQTLTSSQTFSIQMQNGNVTDNGGQVGFNLQDNSGNNIFTFAFLGGGADYQLKLWQSPSSFTQVDTGVGFTSGAMTLSLTEGTGDNWSFSITTGSGTTTLTSAGTGDMLDANIISQVQPFNSNGGASRTLGDNANLYFNNLTVIPEPGTLTLLGTSLLGGLFFWRRRRK